MRLYDARPRYSPVELEDGPLDYDTAADAVARIHARQRAAAEQSAAPAPVVDLVEALYRSLVEARERRMVRS